VKKFFMGNLWLAVLLVGLFASFAEASYTANNLDELGAIYDEHFYEMSGSVEINGQTVSWFTEESVVNEVSGESTIWVDSRELGHIDINDREEVLILLAQALGIPLTSAGSLTQPTSAAATTSKLVFAELIVPTAKTSTEKRRDAAQKAKGGVRTFGGSIRTEWVENAGDENGQITGFNLGMAYDVDNYTFGLMVPYDYFDFDYFNANRIGTILFGQYHLGLTEELEATFTANLNYMFTDFNLGGADDDLNTYGGGLSAALSYSQEDYEVGCGVSYQYNLDDVDLEDDDQHLIKLGGNVGIYMTPDQVINLFGTWNYDATDYKYDYGDTDYFEIGAEYRATFSESWTMNVGYRKVVDLENFDSDMIYLGTAWKF
jgi:hypothetical protein